MNMKIKNNLLMGLGMLALGMALPLLVSMQTGLPLNSLMPLGLLTSVTGLWLTFAYHRMKLASFSIFILLSFQFTNSLIRQNINTSGHVEGFISKNLLLLVGMIVVSITIPLVLEAAPDFFFSKAFILGVCGGVCMLIYVVLIATKASGIETATTAGSTKVFLKGGFTPLELLSKIVVFQLAAILGDRRFGIWRGVIAAGAAAANVLVLFLVIKETGAALMIVLCLLLLLAFCGFGRLCMLGCGVSILGVTVLSALSRFSYRYYVAVGEEKFRRTMPGLLRSLKMFGQRIEEVGAPADNQTHLGLAKMAMSRASLTHGHLQLGHLPMGDSDFAFAGCVEVFGFLAGVILIAALMTLPAVLWWRIIRQCTPNRYIAVQAGIASLFMAQAVTMLLVNIGAAPIVGLPFPFLSRGVFGNLSFALYLAMYESCYRLSMADKKKEK